MDALHKLLTFLTSPFLVGLLMLGAGILWGARSSKHKCACLRFASRALVPLPLLWLYLWSTALMTRWIGLPLEAPYPSVAAETMPEADAICVLGGGMGANTNNCVYPDMNGAADRVWHGARLFKAGKAPIITVSGVGGRESTLPLLKDFGVPESAIVFLDAAKNTEDEARLISSAIKGGGVKSPTPTQNSNSRPKVLLATSAWHMRRAEWLFRRAGLDVVPAPTDHVVTLNYKGATFEWMDIIPNADGLSLNTYLFKEHFAYWCYLLRDRVLGG